MTKTFITGTGMGKTNENIAIWGLTEKACYLGLQYANKLPEASLFLPNSRNSKEISKFDSVESFGSFSECLKENFNSFSGHIFIMAAGIVVRSIASLLRDKSVDPAVVVVDEEGEFAISLLSGHLGGGNMLAHSLGLNFGTKPVITTATDLAGLLAFDSMAVKIGAQVENKEKIKITSSCLLGGIPVALVEKFNIAEQYYKSCKNIICFDTVEEDKLDDFGAVCIISEKIHQLSDVLSSKTLFIRPAVLYVGIGCNSGTSAAEIEEAVKSVFKKYELSLLSVAGFASVDKKSSEGGLLKFIESKGLKIEFWERDEVNAVLDNMLSPPSEHALKHVGIKGAAEPSAILSAGKNSKLIVKKQKIGNVTVAVAKSQKEYKNEVKGKMFLVGIGPGNTDYMTLHSRRVLDFSDVIVGYTSYIKMIEHLTKGKEIISTGMTREIDRVDSAVKNVLQGKTVSLVCSGDTGIYGLAGLVFETAERLKVNIDVEVSPGITAATSAAALVGSPLTNDFIVISLSDLLTPKETVISRIKTAAASDMVTVIYNPKSKKRTELISLLKDEFLKFRDSKTPVASVTHALRRGENVYLSTLSDFLNADIGMNSVLIVGNSDSCIINGRMVTKRGYERKLPTPPSG